VIELGTRPIRTAGKGSGSVEVTLPADLRPMVGLPCRITLHDGAQPDIVLRPDLEPVRDVFAQFWQMVCIAMADALPGTVAPGWSTEAFSFGLHPKEAGQGTPCLAWADGLALAGIAADVRAVGRCAASCASVLAAECDITTAFAADFGAVCGFLMCGQHVFTQWAEPCDIAATSLREPVLRRAGQSWADNPDWRCRDLWSGLRPGFAALATGFAHWSHNPADYLQLRAAWRRGRSIELTQG